MNRNFQLGIALKEKKQIDPNYHVNSKVEVLSIPKSEQENKIHGSFTVAAQTAYMFLGTPCFPCLAYSFYKVSTMSHIPGCKVSYEHGLLDFWHKILIVPPCCCLNWTETRGFCFRSLYYRNQIWKKKCTFWGINTMDEHTVVAAPICF